MGILSDFKLQFIPRLVESVDGSSGSKWGAVLIEAGMSANRHMYRPEVLQKATPLFEGIKAYIDHPNEIERQKALPERSVKDIGGWFTNVKYQEGRGIIGTFTVAESQPWLKALLLQTYTQNPNLVGFSIMADGKVKAAKNGEQSYWDVESIDAAFSCDLVTAPAAGGKIAELLESQQKEALQTMELEGLTVEELISKRPDILQKIQDELKTKMAAESEAAVEEAKKKKADEDEEKAKVACSEEVKKEEDKVSEAEVQLQTEIANALKTLKVQESRMTLKEKLSESDLPKVVKDRISASMSDRVVTPEEIEKAIKDEKEMLGKLAEAQDSPLKIKQTVREMLAPSDKIGKALDGMFDGKVVDGVRPVRSLKEAYAAFTGKDYFEVNSNPSGILRESLGYTQFGRLDSNGRLTESATTTTWAEVLGDSITRKLMKEYNMPGLEDWRKVCSDIVTANDFRTQRRGNLGGYGVLPAVGEGGVYQSLTTPGDEEETYTIGKYGGLEDLTIETIANDDMGAVKRIPTRLARAAKVTLYRYVFGLITSNKTMADGTACIATNHGNLAGGALTGSTLATARQVMRDQTAFVDTGGVISNGTDFMMMKPKYLLVPNELEQQAWYIVNNDMNPETITGTPYTTNANYNKGAVEPIVVDFWTSATKWFLVADPAYCNTIEMAFFGGKQEPELFTQDQPTVGSVWSADKISYKIRHIYGGSLLDWRCFYGYLT